MCIEKTENYVFQTAWVRLGVRERERERVDVSVREEYEQMFLIQ